MLGDVGAGAEVVAHAAHDQQANRVIGGETLAVCGDAVPHVVGDGVAFRGSIEPQRGDAVVDLDAEAGNFQRGTHRTTPASARISSVCSPSRGGRDRTPVWRAVILIG